jgi:ADP-ribose pyrophosphatase
MLGGFARELTLETTHGLLSRRMYKGKHLHFFRSTDGWEYVSRPSAAKGVTIVAVTANSEILLVEQYRTPLRKRVIELPAGLVGDRPDRKNETIEEAVRRELLEETGCECKAVEVLADGPLLPGITDETNALCLAGVGSPQHAIEGGEQQAELGDRAEGEKIAVHSVPLESVVAWLDGQIKVGKAVDLRIYAGLFFLKKERAIRG